MTTIPETPEDCLLHCEHLFPDLHTEGSYGNLLYKMAIAKIEVLIHMRSSAATIAAIEDSHRRAMTLLTRPLQETHDAANH